MSQTDMVNKPPHYTASRIQPLEVNEDWNLGFHLGNTLKYVYRFNKKGSPVQDLQKACFYLERYVINLQKQSRTRFFIERLLRKKRTVYTASQVLQDWIDLPVSFYYLVRVLEDIGKGLLTQNDQKLMLTSALSQIRGFLRNVYDA